VDLEEEPPLA
jgi:hypothetical protein